MTIATSFDSALDDRYSGQFGVDQWFAALVDDVDNAREAVAWARASDEPDVELRLIVGLIEALPPSLHPERLLLADRCATLLGAAVSERVQFQAWLALRRVWVNRHLKRSHDAGHHALRVARTLVASGWDRFILYQALCNFVMSPLLEGHDPGAEAALHEARAIEDVTWPPHRLVWRARAEARHASLQGDMAKCVRWNRRVVEMDRASGSVSSLAVGDLVDAQLAMGDAAGAAEEGTALVESLTGTRHHMNLAYAQLNLAAALLALGEVSRAEALARNGWFHSVGFELQPYWADYLALLAAIKARPRAAATLMGFADAGYMAREQARALNERNASERACALAVEAIGEAEYKRLHAEGASLPDAQIPVVAFAADDLP